MLNIGGSKTKNMCENSKDVSPVAFVKIKRALDGGM